ncbi:MAG: FAD-binding protein [Pseudonocardiales bacterium]|nr:FAD-binding protein [Pseudonocardiales bacterium]
MSWRNWAGNQRATPVRTVAARDAGDVAAAVRAAAERGLRVRAVGSGHSFSAVGRPVDVAVAAPADPALLHVDGDGLASVPAGMTLRVLDDLLWARGRALPNLGDIDAQTVAGAVSTGTHGTGARHGGIATRVRALEMVLADGSLVRCSPDADPDLFSAARVALGALGVLTTVVLATVPAFRLHATESARPLDAVLGGFDEWADAHDHVEFYWFPHTDTAATKCNDRTGATAPARGRLGAWLADEVLANAAHGAACRVGAAAPRLVPLINRVAARTMAATEYTDRSYRVFTSPRRVRFLEMEYAVPRAALPEAFAGLRRAAERHARDVTFPVEVRVAAADDIPLSTASGRDSAYLAVHVHHAQRPGAYFAAVEDVLADLDGRPHWGKLHTLDADRLRARYPAFDAFAAVRDRVDPDRRFGTPHLERVLGC